MTLRLTNHRTGGRNSDFVWTSLIKLGFVCRRFRPTSNLFKSGSLILLKLIVSQKEILPLLFRQLAIPRFGLISVFAEDFSLIHWPLRGARLAYSQLFLSDLKFVRFHPVRSHEQRTGEPSFGRWKRKTPPVARSELLASAYSVAKPMEAS